MSPLVRLSCPPFTSLVYPPGCCGDKVIKRGVSWLSCLSQTSISEEVETPWGLVIYSWTVWISSGQRSQGHFELFNRFSFYHINVQSDTTHIYRKTQTLESVFCLRLHQLLLSEIIKLKYWINDQTLSCFIPSADISVNASCRAADSCQWALSLFL